MSYMLPVLDRPLDNTAIAAYNRCPRLYDFSMRQHRRKGGRGSAAVEFGKLWHTIMDTHYRTDGNELEVLAVAMEHYPDFDREDDYRTFDRAMLEYRNYVKKYGKPSQEQYKTVGWPHQPMIEIAANVAESGMSYPYAGKIDRILVRDGLYYVEDHKTTSRFGSDYFKQWRMSSQMKGYAWLGRQLLGHPIAGVRINLLVARKNDSEFQREVIPFSDAILDEWQETINHTVADIQQSYSTGRFRGVYTDGGCSGKYGMCDYHSVCSVRPGLRQQVLERDFEINPWNPLEAEDLEA